ncbi:unnamed protein product [Lasius platythorax]|uniref:Laminin subunit beta-1 n=2 Tax=Lasius TaxID=488720 RepID=A0A0J7K9C2_LASNI|nr:laminin subunit beta-1 [Lasius niger]
MATDTGNVLADAERFRKHTENLLAKNRASVDGAQERNNESLTKLNEKLKTFGMNIPELNLQMCGSNVTDCSMRCGLWLLRRFVLRHRVGADSKANQALDVAKQQAAKIKSHMNEAEQLLRNMSQIKPDSTAARSNVQDAFNHAWDARNFT